VLDAHLVSERPSFTSPPVPLHPFPSPSSHSPGYFSYAAAYIAWTISALDSTLGSSSGLDGIAGVAGASQFPLYMTGSGFLQGSNAQTWNWGDSATAQEWVPTSQFWGLHYGEAAATYYSRLTSATLAGSFVNGKYGNGAFAEALVFYDPRGSVQDVAALPTFKHYPYGRAAVFRSAWDAPLARQHYIGGKGGDSSWGHAHLDQSSFVFDYAGWRFAEDMGVENYAVPGYFSTPSQRYSYYRSGAWGHNILLFGRLNHAVVSSSTVPVFAGGGDLPARVVVAPLLASPPSSLAPPTFAVTLDGYFVVNVTLANQPVTNVTSHLRGFVALEGASALLVVDDFTFSPASPTPAAPNITFPIHTQSWPVPSAASVFENPSVVNLTLTRGVARVSNVSITVSLIVNDTTLAGCGWAGWMNTSVPLELSLPAIMKTAWGFSRLDAVFLAPDPTACSRIVVGMGNATALAPFLAAGGATLRPVSQWGVGGQGPLITPTPTASSSATASATATLSPSGSAGATMSGSATASTSASPLASTSGSTTGTTTGSVTATRTGSQSADPTPTSTSTYSATVTSTSTGTFSTGASFSPTRSADATTSTGATGSATATASASGTSSPSPSATTSTAGGGGGGGGGASASATPSPSPSPSPPTPPTPTPTPTATATPPAAVIVPPAAPPSESGAPTAAVIGGALGGAAVAAVGIGFAVYTAVAGKGAAAAAAAAAASSSSAAAGIVTSAAPAAGAGAASPATVVPINGLAFVNPISMGGGGGGAGAAAPSTSAHLTLRAAPA
jgi:hypothetical protein